MSQPWKHFLQQSVTAAAGEILLNAVDRGGTMEGMIWKIIREASSVAVPLIAVGSLADIKDAVRAGANAMSAGLCFVFRGPNRR